MQKIEIERKFLIVTDIKEILEASDLVVHNIEQFYEEGHRYRETLKRNVSGTLINTYEKIEKKALAHTVNMETILEVTEDEYEEAKERAKDIIVKSRYHVPYKDLVFEIDVFRDLSLILCEVELKEVDQEVIFPPFLSNFILLEVSSLPEFSNSNLVRFTKNLKEDVSTRF